MENNNEIRKINERTCSNCANLDFVNQKIMDFEVKRYYFCDVCEIEFGINFNETKIYTCDSWRNKDVV